MTELDLHFTGMGKSRLVAVDDRRQIADPESSNKASSILSHKSTSRRHAVDHVAPTFTPCHKARCLRISSNESTATVSYRHSEAAPYYCY